MKETWAQASPPGASLPTAGMWARGKAAAGTETETCAFLKDESF